MTRWLTLLTCFLLTAGAARQGGAPVEIREWPVPWEDTRPRDPAVDGQGRVWFVGQKGDYIGRLDPASGKFDRFELEKGAAPKPAAVRGGESHPQLSNIRSPSREWFG